MLANKISFYNYNINCTTKKNSNTPNFQGNKQKLVTDSLRLSGAISASTLFMMAKKDVKDPQKIIDEFYANENSNLKNTKFDLSRFSEEEKYEINHNLEEIKLYQRAFRAISNAKNEDKTYRFSTQESLELFETSGKQINEHLRIFKQIINAKDKEGKNRFNSNECAKLMSIAHSLKAYPKVLEAILAIKELNAQECQDLIRETGIVIQEKPIILDEALQNVPKDSDDFGKNLIRQIKKIYFEKTSKRQIEFEKLCNIKEEPGIIAQEEKKEEEQAIPTEAAPASQESKNSTKIYIKNIEKIAFGDENIILESGKNISSQNSTSIS